MIGKPYTQDDIDDVIDLNQKIEDLIREIFEENEFEIAMSAFLSASINSVFKACNSIDEVISFRNIFIQTIDDIIRSANFKK